jgi:hypothetical protein
MQTHKRRRIYSFLAILIAGAAICVYLVWNKPHKNVKDADAVEASASDVYNLFIKDSVQARALYTDKVVQVSGRVKKITINQQAQQVLLLQTGLAGAYVNCTMEEKAVSAKENDSIRLKGICSGYINGDADMGLPGDVFFTRCYLLK